jgi:hypothetical protein
MSSGKTVLKIEGNEALSQNVNPTLSEHLP